MANSGMLAGVVGRDEIGLVGQKTDFQIGRVWGLGAELVLSISKRPGNF